MISPVELKNHPRYKPSPWFMFDVRRWTVETMLFNATQRGWLITLICEAAANAEPAGYLPDNDEELKRLAGIEDFDPLIERDWQRVIRKFKKSKKYIGKIFYPRLLNPQSIHRYDYGSPGQINRLGRMMHAKEQGTHTREDWIKLVMLCENKCVRCSATDKKLTRDHVVPVISGGSDSIDNLQPLCQKCNSEKFITSADYVSKEVRQKFNV